MFMRINLSELISWYASCRCTITGSKLWSLGIFQMDTGDHWVQEHLKVRLSMFILHAMSISIIRWHTHSRYNEKVISAMEDNRGGVGCE